MPATTTIIFVEEEIDRRNKLYKIIRDMGTVSEMNGLSEKNLKLFVVSLLDQEGSKLQKELLNIFLTKPVLIWRIFKMK